MQLATSAGAGIQLGIYILETLTGSQAQLQRVLLCYTLILLTQLANQ